MVKFKVIERLIKIGPLKGKKGYGAAPKRHKTSFRKVGLYSALCAKRR